MKKAVSHLVEVDDDANKNKVHKLPLFDSHSPGTTSAEVPAEYRGYVVEALDHSDDIFCLCHSILYVLLHCRS